MIYSKHHTFQLYIALTVPSPRIINVVIVFSITVSIAFKFFYHLFYNTCIPRRRGLLSTFGLNLFTRAGHDMSPGHYSTCV